MTVKEMVEDYLQVNGYGGLVCDEIPCGCVLGDLEPGGDCMCSDVCEAGSVHYCDNCPPANREECAVEDCPCAGGYCVGTEKELKLREPIPPPEPWITDAKLQDTVEFFGGRAAKKMVGVVKIIRGDHLGLKVLVEGQKKLADVSRAAFIRIVEPEENP